MRDVQLRLRLDHDIVALIIPVPLAAEVTDILIRGHCPPAVLAHPYAAEHRILLAGERIRCDAAPATRSTPGHRHRVAPTHHGSSRTVTWVHPPQQNSLRLCREIDVFGAIRAVTTKGRRELMSEGDHAKPDPAEGDGQRDPQLPPPDLKEPPPGKHGNHGDPPPGKHEK
ncbi:MAG: hypothetical protein ACRDTG_02975 [Pseudonocardiaceae bacterium]